MSDGFLYWTEDGCGKHLGVRQKTVYYRHRFINGFRLKTAIKVDKKIEKEVE